MAVGRTIFRSLFGLLFVLVSQAREVSNKDSSSSDEIRYLGEINPDLPPSLVTYGGRSKRSPFTGEIRRLDWHTINPTAVNLSWLGDGDVYDFLVYSGYPVGGGPGLPLYRTIRGRTGNRLELKGLEPHADYLVHIRARKHDGSTGPYFSYGKVTPGN